MRQETMRKLLDTPYLDVAITYVTYVLPLIAFGHLLATSGPSVRGLTGILCGAIANIGLFMSVILHRFLSHRAFRTGPTTRLVLTWAGCLAYQKGPIWWASKHRRHHKFCDTPRDPHSWVQTGFLNAWVGWTVDPKEQGIDYEFLGSLNDDPRLLLVDRLQVLPPFALVWGLQRLLGVHPAYPLMAMLFSRLMTLLFNAEFHPPPPAAGVEKKCHAIDVVRFLSELVGESHRMPACLSNPTHSRC
jgi:fatty-acid desaturase